MATLNLDRHFAVHWIATLIGESKFQHLKK
jgi:hypothetical protein